MTIPAILFGSLFAAFYGAIYHLFRGGGLLKLLFYLGLSVAGFFAGHFIGAWRGWELLTIGPLDLGMASLGSVLLLVLGDWLSRVDTKREPKSDDQV